MHYVFESSDIWKHLEQVYFLTGKYMCSFTFWGSDLQYLINTLFFSISICFYQSTVERSILIGHKGLFNVFIRETQLTDMTKMFIWTYPIDRPTPNKPK